MTSPFLPTLPSMTLDFWVTWNILKIYYPPNRVTDFFLPFVPDGHHVWEMEAKTDRDLCKPVST
jgi:hypothetical protein